MTKNKRFMIDDAGTLIDIQTRNTYDYVSDVCPLLNALNDKNEQLKKENEEFNEELMEYDSFKRLYEEKIERVEKENEQLKERNNNQCNQLKQLWELIEDEDYNTLRSMLNQRETDEKLLQKEWGTYGDDYD